MHCHKFSFRISITHVFKRKTIRRQYWQEINIWNAVQGPTDKDGNIDGKMIYNNAVQGHTDKEGNIDWKMIYNKAVQGHTDKDGNIDEKMIYKNAVQGPLDKIIRNYSEIL